MKQWKFSRYTNTIKSNSGDLLLHNSFMGAVARIPREQIKSYKPFFERYICESDLMHDGLKELCDGGFFVQAAMDESSYVERILEEERNSSVFSMILLPHENCNFRCIYCYEKFRKNKMQPEIIAGLKALVEQKAREYNSIHISWFGGEPLLSIDVICGLSDSFMKSCNRHRVKYTSSMTTNAYLLTPKVFRFLLDRQIKGYQITLDGPEKLHNDSRKMVNGKGTYRTILNNLIGISRFKDAFTIKLRINFNEENTALIENWLENEIYDLFAKDQRFFLAFHPIGKWGGPNDDNLKTCRPENISPLRAMFMSSSQHLGFSDRLVKEYLSPHGHVCYASRASSIVVGSDGMIYKCSKDFDDSRNHVGKLANDGRLLINKDRWDRWINLAGIDTSRCHSCAFFPCCQARNCPLSTMDEGHPLCPLTKNEYKALINHVAYTK